MISYKFKTYFRNRQDLEVILVLFIISQITQDQVLAVLR